jgi:hypothetical protein
MKKTLGILALCLTGSVLAQQKETVHSIVVVCHEIGWYQTQEKLWKAEVDKNKKDAEAWYNYYSAVRAIINLSYDDPAQRETYRQRGHEIAQAAYEAVPETFEGNHLMHWDGGTGTADPKYLNKAYEINPNDPRIFDDILIRAEMERNETLFQEMALKMYQSNELPAGMLNWAWNLLSELDENAIVFSAGDNDTYALWLVQQARNFRKDVQVINTYLITEPNYRQKILKELGLPEFKIEEGDQDFDKLYRHILENKQGIPSYVSTSAMGLFEKDPFQQNLYLTGLAYKYSLSNIDNMSLIRRNYEHRYLTDHLKEVFAVHIADSRALQFKGLYLPALIKLCKHYHSTEEKAKAEELLSLLRAISKEVDQEEDVNELIREIEK